MRLVCGTNLLASFKKRHPTPIGERAAGGIAKQAMTLFGRYMFRQVTNAFLVILLTLTTVVWLATAL